MICELKLAIKEVLKSRRGCVIFLVASFLIFALLILIPVWSTPGNDVFFQLSILKSDVLALLVLLSLTNGLLVTMQFHITRVKKETSLKAQAGKGATALSILVSSLASTIACAACFSAVFAFFSFGTTLFIVEHRAWFATAAIAISFTALYYSARKINNNCQVCTI
ncbi:hypothetical protein IH979_02890 [Patescibacteria group bacterium]|nr:hypothetical protein [Patescibacteria group bacterium]